MSYSFNTLVKSYEGMHIIIDCNKVLAAVMRKVISRYRSKIHLYVSADICIVVPDTLYAKRQVAIQRKIFPTPTACTLET